jgi:putative chitinase
MSSENNADYLMQAAMNAGIRDPKELANFMGQMQVESGDFASLNENLNYSGERLLKVFPGRNGLDSIEQADRITAGGPKAVANAIYGGDWGATNLGNTEPGDAWAYRGRGFVQLTGRHQYEVVGAALGLDLVHHPDLAADRDVAAKVAIYYWQSKVVAMHHQYDVTAACHDINGDENGLKDRKASAQAWENKLEHGHVPGPSNNPTHSTLLKLDDRGDDVRHLQVELAKLGYTGLNGRSLHADGDFGRDTQRALESFQRDHHMTADGKVGSRTFEALQQQSQPGSAPTLLSLKDSRNPDHGLYQQAFNGVQYIDAQVGRTSDQHSTNLAAALVVAAKQEGFKQIDAIALSADGSRAFAVQGNGQSSVKEYAAVETAQAVQTSLEQSSALAAAMPSSNAARSPLLPLDQSLSSHQVLGL